MILHCGSANLAHMVLMVLIVVILEFFGAAEDLMAGGAVVEGGTKQLINFRIFHFYIGRF
jgi:hypothetical protein